MSEIERASESGSTKRGRSEDRHRDPGRARVLVIDDSGVARRKLALAVASLGHQALEAGEGRTALALLESEPFDLVLLDIVMPDVDGFAVLQFLRAHPRLRDLPVIVVSGLENEPGAVTDAIRLGAVDFLPKAFEAVLLNARIGAALRRKRNRDRELAEIAAIERLAEAAALLETSLVNSTRLGLDDLAGRADPLGRFAAVFTTMAVRMHARESALRRRLVARRTLALLIVAGILFGLATPLSKIAASGSPHAMGLSLWVNAIAATLCLSLTAWRDRWPVWNAALLRFLLLWGTFGSALAEVMLFHVATFLPASTLSVVIALESFIVFGAAALAGHERANVRRLGGLLLGLLGVLLVIQSQEGGVSGASAAWLLVALVVPACYAIEDILLATRLPSGTDFVAATGFASLVGALLLAGPVWWFGQGVSPASVPPSTVVAVVGIALASLVGTVLHARLTATAGAVFGSQTSYVITLAGIVWAMLLLGERPAATLWAALGLLCIGLLLVEPKREPDDVLDVGVFEGGGSGRPAARLSRARYRAP